MKEVTEWLDQHFWWLFAAACAWMLLHFALGISSRRRNGLYVFRPDLPEALFLETWCSGRVGFTGANNCLWVAITEDALLADAHFPFNMPFYSPLSPLHIETKVPIQNITAVEPKQGFFGRSVIVRFRDREYAERSIELILRHEEQFLENLELARHSGEGAVE